MKSSTTLIYESEVFLDKAKIKKVYLVGAFLFLVSVGCIIWAKANWEAYSDTYWSMKYNTYVESGLAPILWGWGWAFAVAIPLIYGLMWLSFDFKQPAIAANRDGLFLNRELFKSTFVKWDEFDRIEKQADGSLWLYFKDPTSIIAQQPKWRRPFLKQTYIKDQSPISIENKDKEQTIISSIKRHNNL